MSKLNLENKKLDQIGKALVKADAMTSRDIEKIVSSPTLFDSVRARIASETERPVARRSFLRPTVAIFACVAFVAVIGWAVVTMRSEPAQVAVRQESATPQATVSESKRFSEPDHILNPELPRPVETSVKSERVSTRPIGKQTVRPKRPEAQQVGGYEGDFYALSYAGDPNETERGGRIVRVDIPRTTLFAMGVDVPLENETETVKADLLVGPDGVTRGIRVVR